MATKVAKKKDDEKTNIRRYIEDRMFSGDFILSDMSYSKYFVDMLDVILQDDCLGSLSNYLKKQKWQKKCKAIVGIEHYTGSVVLASILSILLDKPCLIVHLPPSIPISDQLYDQRVVGKIPNANSSVLLVTPLTVTGKSSLRASLQLTRYDLSPIIFTILDRSNGIIEMDSDVRGWPFHSLFSMSELDLESQQLINYQNKIENLGIKPIGVFDYHQVSLFASTDSPDLKEEVHNEDMKNEIQIAMIQPHLMLESDFITRKDGFIQIKQDSAMPLYKEVFKWIQSLDTDIDVIIFPELILHPACLPYCYEFAEKNNSIIIPGSFYNRKRNVSPIIFPDTSISTTEKIQISSIEKSINEDIQPNPGRGRYHLKTRLGNVIIPICSDILDDEYRNILSKHNFSLLINPSMNNNSDKAHMEISEFVRKYKIYACYSNSIVKSESGKQYADGKSAFFAQIHSKWQQDIDTYSDKFIASKFSDIEHGELRAEIARMSLFNRRQDVNAEEPNIHISKSKQTVIRFL